MTIRHSKKCLIYSLGNPEFTFGESELSSLGKFEFTFFTNYSSVNRINEA
jgi:hypothetical protein